jgi:pimeloyl-ACP methyl ester carboxylesterase
MDLNYNAFERDQTTDQAKTLAVFLHGSRTAFWRPLNDMKDPIAASREALTGGVDVYAPTLPYADPLDRTGALTIVARLAADLDAIWKERSHYADVIFVGHSMGGILLRRLFLAGSPRSPDYAGDFEQRDDLSSEEVSRDENAHGWAAKVKRLVMIATWDKGWSISERDGWKYWFGLNFLGFLGHIPFPYLRPIASTMFDMRRGAPFIVQTRLLWLAYRRWHNPDEFGHLIRQQAEPPRGADPIVVQIVGTLDDFVSPLDQVDNEVNGDVPPSHEHARYFLLEMPNTNHDQAIQFSETCEDNEKKIRAKRGEMFRLALLGRANDHSQDTPGADALFLKDKAHDPSHYGDDPIKPDNDVRDVVFVMHGIRDDGYWTHRIAKEIKEEAAKLPRDDPRWNIHSLTPTYGYFAMLPFVLPWIRRQKVEWFMDLYVNTKARFPNATMHYVGHSNGTYLAARALKDYAAARFGNIYFAGSVVSTDYNWPALVAEKRVERVHNARGATDEVVAMLPKSVDYCSDLGGAGFDGFGPPTPPSDTAEITQSKRYALGGHGGAITEPHWPEIAKFIVTGAKPAEPDALFQEKPDPRWDVASRLRLGIPAVVTLVLYVVLQSLAWLFPLGLGEGKGWRVLSSVDWLFFLGFVAFFSATSFIFYKWSESGPKAWFLRALLVMGAVAVLFWFGSLLYVEFSYQGLAFWAFVMTLFLALIRVVLTKF